MSLDKTVDDLFAEAEAAEAAEDPRRALGLYRRILEAAPGNPRAEAALDRIAPFRRKDGAVAAPAAPGQAEMTHLLDLHRTGKLEEAVAAAEALLARYPKVAPVHALLGSALADLGRRDEAITAYRRAVTLKPDYLPVWFNLGNALREAARPADAVIAYRRALAIGGDNPDILTNLGNALREQSLWDDAIDAFAKAVAARPEYAEGHYNLGTALMTRDRIDEAIAAFQHAVAIRPDYAEAFNNLGDAFLEAGNLDAAEAACRRALEIRPDYVNGLNGLGNVLKERGQYEAAAEAYRRALSAAPDYSEAGVNLGNVLAEMERTDEAFAAFRQVAQTSRISADAQCNMGSLHLRRGEFAEGLPLYEWRKQTPSPVGMRSFAQPTWLGGDHIAGKSVFIHYEQGLGDTIQFMRYVPMVRDLGAKVSFAVQAALYPLLRNAIPGVEILAGDAVPAQFDFHVPLLSLPLAFGTRLETIPAEVPYLSADPDRVREWAARLGGDGFKVGICWQGARAKVDRGRSFPLAQFAGIAGVPGVRLISLHKGAGEGQIGILPTGMNVEVPGPQFDPPGAAFLDTAAVMKSCDLVITSDTSIAHLAGALGVPVWVVLRHVADWRWFEQRSDSPWYPTMRLFRQSHAGDWTAPFAEVERAVRALVEPSA